MVLKKHLIGNAEEEEEKALNSDDHKSCVHIIITQIVEIAITEKKYISV